MNNNTGKHRALIEHIRYKFDDANHRYCFVGNKCYVNDYALIVVFDCNNPSIVAHIPLYRIVSVIGMISSLDGKVLYVLTSMAILFRIKLSTNKVNQIALTFQVNRFSHLTAGEDALVFISAADGTVYMFDTVTQKIVDSIAYASLGNMTYLPSCNIVIKQQDTTIWAYHTKTKTNQQISKAREDIVRGFCILGENTVLYDTNSCIKRADVLFINGQIVCNISEHQHDESLWYFLKYGKQTPDKKHVGCHIAKHVQQSMAIINIDSNEIVFSYKNNRACVNWDMSAYGQFVVNLLNTGLFTIYRFNFGFGPVMKSGCFSVNSTANVQLEIYGPEGQIVYNFPNQPPVIAHTITADTVIHIISAVRFSVISSNNDKLDIIAPNKATANTWVDSVRAIVHNIIYPIDSLIDITNAVILGLYMFDILQVVKHHNNHRGIFNLAIPRDVIDLIGFYIVTDKQ